MTTSEQARADAIADAETLRLFPLFARDLSAGVRLRLFIDPHLADYRTAVSRARAAFRAVPGLRG